MDIIPSGVLVFAILGSLGVGIFIGGILCEKHWFKICIERGLAQYNPQTGDWEWLDTAQPIEASVETERRV